MVTAGLIMGTLTYRHVTGQAVAELAGAAWERDEVVHLFGEDRPGFWYNETVTTNRVTNYTATVTLEYVSGTVKCNISPVSLAFSSANWSSAQSVSIARKSPFVYGGGGTYAVKYNGVSEGNVYIDAQDFESGPGSSFGAFSGAHVSWTPLSVIVGDTVDNEPFLASVVLLAEPTDGDMTISESVVVTAVSGKAAITPFIRNDQMQFFIDCLRESVAGYGGVEWLDSDPDFSTLVGAPGIAALKQPQFTSTTTVVQLDYSMFSEDFGGLDAISGRSLWPTGGLEWVFTGTAVTSTPSFYTLSTMSFYTNEAANLNYFPDLFEVPGGTQPVGIDTNGLVTYWPFMAALGADALDLSAYPRDNGSWWFDAGMHSNTVWQVQGREFVVEEDGMYQDWVDGQLVLTPYKYNRVKESSLITTNDYDKCRVMCEAMTRTITLDSIHSDTNTRTRVITKSASGSATATNSVTYTNATATSVAYAVNTFEEYSRITDRSGGYVSYVCYAPTWTQDGSVSYSDTSYNTAATNRSVTYSRVTDAYTDYPSRYAITNGYVSRVRVYAMYTASRGAYIPFAADVPGAYEGAGASESSVLEAPDLDGCDCNTGISPIDGARSVTRTVTASNSGDWGPFYDDEVDFFSLGVSVAGFAAPPALAFDAAGRTYDVPSGNSAGKDVVRVTLLVDVSDPTEYPIRFSYGPESLGIPDTYDYEGEVVCVETTSLSDYWRAGPGEFSQWRASVENSTAAVTETIKLHTLSRSLECSSEIFVVVDWNFKHMNPANPYVPEPFVPAWLTPAP